ncbi:response regulator [Aquimonas voraii]|uniref:Two component transcriptional regulator, LuxR family n=1 Tax=Aquimonas voraii TaxID=265719 RepID=A0A1G6UF40_9GAMM|nr:response regulator transcription factor [Aquimonas voraii]SDD39207.1 two component transcriptional regulator, LuxR family [Aquimonas voraii]
MSESAVRLMLVDDHAVVREGLRAVFLGASGCEVVAEAGSGDEALRLLESVRPDVVMMDLMMPGLSAAETIARLKQQLPQCNVIVFTSFGEDEALRATLQAGAMGYLLKDAARHDLLSAVHSVAQGRPWLNESMQRQLLELMRRPAPEDPLAGLTPRERSVLELIGQGMNNRRIATHLGLTEGTVKGYVSTVLEKLGVDDRTQAALAYSKLKPQA